MKINAIQVVACLFVILSVGAFIGLRLDATWTGGDGMYSLLTDIYVMEGSVDVQHDDTTSTIDNSDSFSTLSRGEIIRTQEGSRSALTIGDAVEVILDENTDLELEYISQGDIELALHRGRVIIATDQVRVTLNGKHSKWIVSEGVMTAVNYDFLETFVVAPNPAPEEYTEVFLLLGTDYVQLHEPVSYTETPPGSWEYTEFDYNLDFYNYVPPALQGMGY